MNIVVSNPWLMVVDDLLTEKECADIIKIGERGFSPSDSFKGDRYKNIRTSGHTFIKEKDYNKSVQKLCDVTSLITKTPEENAENGCIIKYLPGEEYKAHYDYFVNSPHEDQLDEKYEKSGDRIFSVIFYLNDAYLGGTTDFPKINLKVHPKPGRALVFRNYVDGKPNALSLHAGRPVEEGVKYIVTKWVREKDFSESWRDILNIKKPIYDITWEKVLGYDKRNPNQFQIPFPDDDEDDCGCDKKAKK